MGCRLAKRGFERCGLEGATFIKANLLGANLERADLRRTNLVGSDLQNANLQLANLQKAWLGAVQINAFHKIASSVLGVDLTKTKYDFEILQEQIKDMFGHKTETKLPVGMKVPKHWSEANMDTDDGEEIYYKEWKSFRRKKGWADPDYANIPSLSQNHGRAWQKSKQITPNRFG